MAERDGGEFLTGPDLRARLAEMPFLVDHEDAVTKPGHAVRVHFGGGAEPVFVINDHDYQALLKPKPRESWLRRTMTLSPWHFKTVAVLPSIFMVAVSVGLGVTGGGIWNWLQAVVWVILTTLLLAARIDIKESGRG